jgi:hypothetical protein
LNFECATNPENLEAFKKSQRIYHAVVSPDLTNEDTFFVLNDEFLRIFENVGAYIKFLKLDGVDTSILMLWKLLACLPNLESLYLESVESFMEEANEVTSVSLNMPKLKSIGMSSVDNRLIPIINQIKGCNFSEAEFEIENSCVTIIKSFVNTHQSYLKKLCLKVSYSDDISSETYNELFSGLTSLRLTSFEFEDIYSNSLVSNQNFLNFLSKQCELKSLTLNSVIPTDFCLNLICENLPHLQTLQMSWFEFGTSTELGWRNLFKLSCLKKIHFDGKVPFNILNGLTLGRNTNLREINSHLKKPSPEFLRDLSLQSPNLKSLKLTVFHRSVQDLLIHFENLEDLSITVYKNNNAGNLYIKLQDKPLIHMKHLSICASKMNIVLILNAHFVQQFVKNYPNLEELRLGQKVRISDSLFELLLRSLKHLKKLSLESIDPITISDKMLDCISKFGGNLECLEIGGTPDIEKLIREKLNNCKGLKLKFRKLDMTV